MGGMNILCTKFSAVTLERRSNADGQAGHAETPRTCAANVAHLPVPYPAAVVREGTLV